MTRPGTGGKATQHHEALFDRRRFRAKSNLYYIGLGISVLLVGVAVYVSDRPPGNILFVTNHVTTYSAGHLLFGRLGGSLPSLCHVVGFSMITYGLFPPSVFRGLVIPLFWGTVDICFELSQLLVSHIRAQNDMSGSAAVSQLAQRHWINGTFDWFDVVAILVGVAMCVFLFQLQGNRRLK